MLVQHQSVPYFSFFKDLFISWDIWRSSKDLFHELCGLRNVCLKSKELYVLCLISEVRMSIFLGNIWYDWNQICRRLCNSRWIYCWSSSKPMPFYGYLNMDSKPEKQGSNSRNCLCYGLVVFVICEPFDYLFDTWIGLVLLSYNYESIISF